MFSFYQNIPAFKDFEQIKDEKNFRRVPEDWVILVSDIKGSTQAVKSGNSKTVNMLGAAPISLVSNTANEYNTPSVFGGDGSTLLLPFSFFQKIRPQLVGLIRMAKLDFNITLRIGAVRISDLEQNRFPIFLGKYQVSPSTFLAQLTGSGVTAAESYIKSQHPQAILISEDEPEYEFPNLSGLSCRMDKFKSLKGRILTLIIKSNMDDNSQWIRCELLGKIKVILNDDFQKGNPVSQEKMKWRMFPETIRTELKFNSKDMGSFLATFFRILMANFLLKFNISAGGFKIIKYKSELTLQSDYKKFDDCLRLVLDCSPEQIQMIQDLLSKAKKEGKIHYGTSEADSAVISCFTMHASQGEHIHFIDGDQGGYTRAAEQIKLQIKSENLP